MWHFTDYFDLLRDELTLGNAMRSAQCTTLAEEEHQQLAQAFNMGVTLSWSDNIASAAAQMGGPSLLIDCDLWDNEIGSEWFGTLITHELGHMAGYSHPEFTAAGMVYDSKCNNLGSSYCPGHCMEWTSACQNHMVFGSKACGFGNTGCKTTCVHSDYCQSMPERTTECFGYQKVHSRGESMRATGNAGLERFSDKMTGMLCLYFGVACDAAGANSTLVAGIVLLAFTVCCSGCAGLIFLGYGKLCRGCHRYLDPIYDCCCCVRRSKHLDDEMFEHGKGKGKMGEFGKGKDFGKGKGFKGDFGKGDDFGKGEFFGKGGFGEGEGEAQEAQEEEKDKKHKKEKKDKDHHHHEKKEKKEKH